MSEGAQTDVKTTFASFAQATFLHVFVPNSTKAFAAANIEKHAEELVNLPSRRHLFFDEIIDLYVVLRSTESEEAVRNLLPQLELTISAHITDTTPEATRAAISAAAKHDISTTKLPATACYQIASSGDAVHIAWQVSLHITRPRARLQRPAVYFTANLAPEPDSLQLEKLDQKRYLKSYESLPANVLEPLAFDMTRSDHSMFLSETRITKVAPPSQSTEDSIKPVRGASKRAFPVISAMFPRVNSVPLAEATIVSLRLEASQLNAGDLTIDDIKLDIADVLVDAMSFDTGRQVTCPGDEYTALFKVTERSAAAANSSTRVAHLVVKATLSSEDGTEAKLDVRWQVQIDIKTHGSKTTHRWSPTISSRKVIKPGALEDQKRVNNTSKLTFTLSAPPVVPLTSEFALRVQCLNGTERQRRFALTTAQAVGPGYEKSITTLGGPESASKQTWPGATRDRQQHGCDVQVLTPDVRLGPLAPKACFESIMRLKAISSGVLDLGMIRIVDLDSRQVIDLPELPEVIALEVVAT